MHPSQHLPQIAEFHSEELSLHGRSPNNAPGITTRFKAGCHFPDGWRTSEGPRASAGIGSRGRRRMAILTGSATWSRLASSQ